MKVFVGYDPREDIAYQVCKHSLESKNGSVYVQPLKLSELEKANYYWRDKDPLSSTEFTFSRFLVPAICDYKGWALFCDCDILFLEDIKLLFDQADDRYAVMCVKHDYTPPVGIKMDLQAQLPYPRKNWSSVVLFNCGHPSNQTLTKELVNDPTTTGKYLHRFSWLADEEIGEISCEWNWLVGWYKEPKDGSPKVLHYTEGGPWFERYRNCEYHQIWKQNLTEMMNG